MEDYYKETNQGKLGTVQGWHPCFSLPRLKFLAHNHSPQFVPAAHQETDILTKGLTEYVHELAR